MERAIDALKQSYREVMYGKGICRPRMALWFPTHNPFRISQWGAMEGSSARTGCFATRMTDIRFQAVQPARALVDRMQRQGGAPISWKPWASVVTTNQERTLCLAARNGRFLSALIG